MNVWWAVDRIEGLTVTLVPALFEIGGGEIQVPRRWGVRVGQVYRWDGRRFKRDRAYEREAAKYRASPAAGVIP